MKTLLIIAVCGLIVVSIVMAFIITVKFIGLHKDNTVDSMPKDLQTIGNAGIIVILLFIVYIVSKAIS